MRTKTICVNYNELNIALNKIEEDYPSRIYWDIDLFRANINEKLLSSLQWNNIVFEIDDTNKIALLWWKEIEGSVYAFPDFDKSPTTSEKMYYQIINAIEQAKELWFYEKAFKESEE